MSVDYVQKEQYAEVLAKGSVSGAEFAAMYERLFKDYENSPFLKILVNILDYQNQLSVEDFTEILSHADQHGIQEIDMVVVTLDPARPLIGEMLEALAQNFHVNIQIRFCARLGQGETLLLKS